MKATREDVLSCYRHILGREPENEEALAGLVDWDFWVLVNRFSHSDEHRAKISRLSSSSLLKFQCDGSLARNLDRGTRLSSIIHNYAFLREQLGPGRLLLLMEDGLDVVDGFSGDPEIVVRASLFDAPAAEGEVSLDAYVAGRRVAVLTFTIIAGEDFGLAAGPALLISRLQGYRGVASDYLRFKDSVGVAPPLFLFAVLEGIAAAMGLTEVLAVGGSNHPSFEDDKAAHYEKAYDLFFTSLGGLPGRPGFHHLRLPRDPSAGDERASSHRARRRKRRMLRNDAMEQARSRWQGHLQPSLARSSPEQGQARHVDQPASFSVHCSSPAADGSDLAAVLVR